MKILYLTPGCFDKGGISRYSRYQIQALRDLYGNDAVRVLSLMGPDAEAFEEAFPVYWHGSDNGTWSKVRFTLQMFWEILTWQPTHVHTAHVNLSGLSFIAAKLSSARTTLNVYGLEVWSGLSRDASFGLRRTERILSDCHFTANYLETEGIRTKGSTTVIWDCVDLVRFSPAPPNVSVLAKYGIPDPATHPIVLSLGRLAKAAAHKGYDRLIDAFSRIAAQHPEARLVIAGKGDNKGYYEALAAEKGIASQTIFTGMVAEEDLVEVYRAGAIFSLVSDRGKGRGEGIPLTPLEAMACGTAVIVGNQDGSQEAVVGNPADGRNGTVIDPFDIPAHAATLSAWLNDPALLSSKRREAVEVAHQFFAYEGFVAKHRTFYSE